MGAFAGGGLACGFEPGCGEGAEVVDNFERTAGLRAALLGLHAFAQIILIADLAFTVRKFNQFYINRN